MTITVAAPRAVELRALRPGDRALGRRVWVPRVDEVTGAASWASDYRAASDPFEAVLEGGRWYVRVCAEVEWYRWRDAGRPGIGPRPAAAWRLDLVRVECGPVVPDVV